MVHFQKSSPEPECLAHERTKARGTHRCEGVFERLILDFRGKCYLCEKPGSSDLEIEHFVEPRGSQALKLGWTNLFLVCHHCNNTKQAVAAGMSLVNCTDHLHLVDSWLSYRLNYFPKESRVEIEALYQTQEVLNTAALLRTIYNGHKTEQKMWNSKHLRDELSQELTDFLYRIRRYLRATEHDRRKARDRNAIIAHLQNISAFTAFKRWIIRDDVKLYAEFGKEF